MLSALRFPKPPANPRLPDGVRIYAISDIHGCAHLLERMLAVIDADVAHSRSYRAIEVFLGDYIDRGPDSRSTLDLLIRRARGGNAVFLKGNHEAFLAEVFLDPSRISDWFRLGARPHAGSQCGDFGKPGQH
jgi:serine/threonine protein phosphatase 1